ncbi:MAG: hypothetical protein AB1798_19150 [Spirochaetota bacterium]
MQAGEWYREEVVNPNNGKTEWKYYHITDVLYDNNLGIEVYKVYWNGKISDKHVSQCSAEALAMCTRVAKDFALGVLHLPDEDTKNGEKKKQP